MSDHTTVTYFDVQVSDQDAQDFIDSFGAKPECPTCSSNNWQALVTTPEKDEFLSVRTTKIGGFPGDNYIPIYIVSCGTCGFTKQYMARQLADWVRSKRDDAK
ncbi:TPA: hypothetical protein ACKQAW_003386 [Stenotrophomonas maltophilia]